MELFLLQIIWVSSFASPSGTTHFRKEKHKHKTHNKIKRVTKATGGAMPGRPDHVAHLIGALLVTVRMATPTTLQL